MKKPTARKYFVIGEDTPFGLNEAYKTARTNLIFALNSVKKKGCKVVVVSSSMIADGKTVTCLNMAVAFAQAGNKVLLVDADMRKSRLHSIFGLNPVPGLSDVLGDFTQNKCLRKTRIPNLILMPAGTIPPNPAELLMSDNFKELVATGFDAFDYVFIDTPPIGIVTDAAIIAPLTDGVILVSKQGYTDKSVLAESGQAFMQVGAKLLGHMFNDVDYDKYSYKYKYRSNGGKYHYKHYYGSYSRNNRDYDSYDTDAQ